MLQLEKIDPLYSLTKEKERKNEKDYIHQN